MYTHAPMALSQTQNADSPFPKATPFCLVPKGGFMITVSTCSLGCCSASSRTSDRTNSIWAVAGGDAVGSCRVRGRCERGWEVRLGDQRGWPL